MRVLVNGLPFFSKKIVQDLNEFDDENRYIFCDTYTSKMAQLKYAMLLPFAGAVLSSRGVTSKSNSLDLALRFNKKLLMQWHGTDVQEAVERNANETINRDYIDVAKHIVSAPWFEEELKGIVDVYAYAPFSYVKNPGNDGTYDSISILTYIAEGRESYYGWEQVKELAKKLPEVKVNVIGCRGTSFEAVDNINFLGWVDEVKVTELLKENAIFLRLTEHDGKSISVSQALGAGCEVIWNYPLEHCHFVERNAQKVYDKIIEVQQLIELRGLKPNGANIEFANSELNRTIVLKNFVDVIKSALYA